MITEISHLVKIKMAKLKILSSFPSYTSEHKLMIGIVQRAIEDLMAEKTRMGAWEFLCDCWAAEVVGIRSEWMVGILIKIGLEPSDEDKAKWEDKKLHEAT
tara:strand:+ start:5157 stop:5459 length:303 start_codon:yes stop_codon:yes gene_type:complete